MENKHVYTVNDCIFNKHDFSMWQIVGITSINSLFGKSVTFRVRKMHESPAVAKSFDLKEFKRLFHHSPAAQVLYKNNSER